MRASTKRETPLPQGAAAAPGSDWTRQPVILAALLLALVMVVYQPALRAGFVWDDDKYVTENPLLTAPDGLRQIWFSTHTQSQYFPLVYTTFRLERRLWGLNPLGFHLVNILLHGINAILVWGVLRRLRVPGAWVAAALFAVHPVQVESVAWVTELKNVESLLFYLLAVLAWIRWVERLGGGGWKYYLLALGAGLLALFAKTTACTLPVALVLVLWLRGERLSWRRVAQVAPFVAAAVAMGLVSVWWEGNLGTYNEETRLAFTFGQRVLIAGRALWFYAGKLAWPVNLCFSYPRWEVTGADWRPYLALAGCAGAAVALWFWRRRLGVGVIAGIVFFVAALAPLLGFISLYTFQYAFVADHYQYPASIGLIAVFAGGVAAVSRRRGWPPLLTGAAQAILLAVLGSLTWQQCGAYRNAETLWRDTLAKNPESWMAHYNLALELQDRGQADEAVEHYRLAVLHNPRHAKAESNLGLLLAAKGNLPEAIACYRVALQIAPDFAMAHNNLAVALASQGNYAEAVTHLERAVQLAPTALGVWMNLGEFLRVDGKTNEALACYRKAADHFPAEAEVWRRYGAAAAEQGQPEQAVLAYGRAVQCAPNRLDVLAEFGASLVSQGNYDEAIGILGKAVAAAPKDAVLHYNLGIALAMKGLAEGAKQEFQEALRLKPDFEEARKQMVLLSLRPLK